MYSDFPSIYGPYRKGDSLAIIWEFVHRSEKEIVQKIQKYI